MKKLLAILLAAVMVAGLFAGCTTGAKGGELDWNLGTAGPKTMDPGLCGASDGGDLINNTFEGLIREKSGIVQPGIAKSWETSEDGKTVTFKLRRSKWSDGSKLTAHDFVYAWLRAMNPDTASEYAWLWHYTHIVGADEYVNGEGTAEGVGIRAVDDYTFEVKLTDPTGYFVSLMSFYTFMPVKQSAVEAEGGEEGLWASTPELAVSNGPFVLTEYTIGEGLRLEANENYWNKKEVGLSAINSVFIDDQNTAYQAYQSGDLHFITDLPIAEIPQLKATDPNFYIFPLLGTYYYNFNMDLDLWQDVRVRKAMALAIDRDTIVDTLGTGQVAAAGFVPPGMLDHEGRDFFKTAGTYGIATDDSKVAEAQALMAEAGYPNGEGFPEFVMMYNTSENHKAVAEMIQEMFKKNLGITCTLENQEWAVFQDTRTAGDYELSRGGWLTDFMDPAGMLGIFKNLDVAYNDPNYYNAEYEKAMNEASSAVDPKAHFEALYRAQEILMTDMPIIPVYHYSENMLVNPKVEGWDRSVLGSLDFSTATIAD